MQVASRKITPVNVSDGRFCMPVALGIGRECLDEMSRCVEGISEEPDLGMAAPLADEKLQQYFGTVKPTKEMVSKQINFLTSVRRGHCIYFTVFEAGQPSELFFGGYSFD